LTNVIFIYYLETPPPNIRNRNTMNIEQMKIVLKEMGCYCQAVDPSEPPGKFLRKAKNEDMAGKNG
jgi:hypothetical protein